MVQFESQIEILLWNIHGNRNCIEKLQILNVEGNTALFTEKIQPDSKITINSTVYCQVVSLVNIVLTDSDNNQIGNPKMISLLTFFNEYPDKLVLVPRNDKILANCGKTIFFVKIFCKNTLKEKTSLIIRRYLALNENLLDWDIGEKMTGKYCSLVDADDDKDFWTFIGPENTGKSVVEEQNQSTPPPSHSLPSTNNCQNVLIYQISIFLLLLVIISFTILLYFKIIKPKPLNTPHGVPEERPATSNVSIMRNSLPSRNSDLTSLRKRQGWITVIDRPTPSISLNLKTVCLLVKSFSLKMRIIINDRLYRMLSTVVKGRASIEVSALMRRLKTSNTPSCLITL